MFLGAWTSPSTVSNAQRGLCTRGRPLPRACRAGRVSGPAPHLEQNLHFGGAPRQAPHVHIAGCRWLPQEFGRTSQL